MLRYEVTLEVEPPRAAALVAYLRDEHIPAIFATGCFRAVRLERASPTRLRASYVPHSGADLDAYLREHAPALRRAFQERFPTGVALARETWSDVAVWE